jgi:hypothetical protein
MNSQYDSLYGKSVRRKASKYTEQYKPRKNADRFLHSSNEIRN